MQSNSSSCPWPSRRRDPEDLAGIEFERDVVEQGTAAQPAHFQRCLPVARRSETGRRRGRDRDRTRCFGAQHERDDALLAAVRALGDADGDAVAQHRRAVAKVRHLGHAVGNEDDGVAPLAPVPDHRVNPLGKVSRKRSRDFVEQQHGGLRRERTGEIDQSERRVRQVANQDAEIEPDDAQLRQPFPHRVDGGPG